MNLIQRYQPSLSWVDELDRLFDRTIRNLSNGSPFREAVYESDEAWILHLDLPGFKKENVSIKVTDRLLQLTAETSSEQSFGGKIERQWTLGCEVDGSGVEAKLENGVHLKVALPGVRKEDLKLSIHESNLQIQAPRHDRIPESWKTHRDGGGTIRYELNARLTNRLDGSKVEASLEDGVLSLHLPLREDAKPREIRVS